MRLLDAYGVGEYKENGDIAENGDIIPEGDNAAIAAAETEGRSAWFILFRSGFSLVS